MKCALSMITHPAGRTCQSIECSAWDSEKNQCLITSYLGAYVKQQMLSLEMVKATERMSKAADKLEADIDEMEGDDDCDT